MGRHPSVAFAAGPGKTPRRPSARHRLHPALARAGENRTKYRAATACYFFASLLLSAHDALRRQRRPESPPTQIQTQRGPAPWQRDPPPRRPRRAGRRLSADAERQPAVQPGPRAPVPLGAEVVHHNFAALWILPAATASRRTCSPRASSTAAWRVAGAVHHPAWQHHRPCPDPAQQPPRHPLRRAVPGAAAQQLLAPTAPTCRRSCGRWSPAAGSASTPGSAAVLNTFFTAVFGLAARPGQRAHRRLPRFAG